MILNANVSHWYVTLNACSNLDKELQLTLRVGSILIPVGRLPQHPIAWSLSGTAIVPVGSRVISVAWSNPG